MSKISKDLKTFKEYLEIEDYIEDDEIENYNLELLIDKMHIAILYLEDERHDSYTLHSLNDILITTILALFSNCNTFVEIHLFAEKHYKWLKKYLNFYYGLPSISTFKRVISIINPKELEEMCNKVFFSFVKLTQPIFKKGNIQINDIYTMDGKVAKASKRNTYNEDIKSMNAMSVYSIKYEKCLMTEFIGEKTNEIPTAPELLLQLNLKNVAITFDALNTQEKTIETIANAGGFYVAPIKDNHSNLYEDLIEYFNNEKMLKDVKKYELEQTEKSHNQVETRKYIFTNDINWIYQKEKWKKIKSIGVVIKKIDGKEVEKRYFISNIESNNIEIIGQIIRKEWSIENKLHWYLDMVFEEDKNKCYIENSQKNLNIIRKFCLGVLKIVKEQYKKSMNLIRLQISMDFENEIEQLLKLL